MPGIGGGLKKALDLPEMVLRIEPGSSYHSSFKLHHIVILKIVVGLGI